MKKTAGTVGDFTMDGRAAKCNEMKWPDTAPNRTPIVKITKFNI